VNVYVLDGILCLWEKRLAAGASPKVSKNKSALHYAYIAYLLPACMHTCVHGCTHEM